MRPQSQRSFHYQFVWMVVGLEGEWLVQSARSDVVSSISVDDRFSVDVLDVGKVLRNETVAKEDNHAEDGDLVEALSEDVLGHDL